MSERSEYRNYSAGARRLARRLDAVLPVLAPALRLVPPRGRAPEVPRSILVVRLDHLGDVLMSTPAIAALRQAFPAARIDVLAAPWGRAALEANPDVDRVREGIAPWYDPRAPQLPPLGRTLRLSLALRRDPYDWGFDFRGDPRTVLFHLLPAARRRFGFSRLGLESLLTDQVPYDRERSFLDLCLDLVAVAGASPVRRRPIFAVGEASRRRADRILGEHLLPPGARFCVVAPSANRPPARWEAERFAAVIEGLGEEGTPVLLVGREEDRPVTARVGAAARGRAIDLTGVTGLGDLAAVLERASVLVCNDSGPAHLAVAVNCPTVAIFGPTDPSITFPYADGNRFIALSAPIDHARPCFDGSCTSDHGFSKIAPDEVLSICRRLLTTVQVGGPLP